MSESGPSRIGDDVELLALAAAVLRAEQYEVEELATEQFRMVLAENRYFIIGVAAAPTIQRLFMLQEPAETILTGRLNEVDLGPKRWDAYLILLTQERLAEVGVLTEELFEISYDTRGIRRVVRTGVVPTLAELRNALIPFVPPIELDSAFVAADPYVTFIDSLVERGVDRETAVRAVTAFRQGARIGDTV